MMYHVYSKYNPTNANTIRRMTLASATWARQKWKELPIEETRCRLFQDKTGKFPYIKDILDNACQAIELNDIIVFTNADICVHSNCSQIVAASLQSCSAIYAFRRDFGLLRMPISDDAIKTGYNYAGTDLFAFRSGWWIDYRDYYPDMLLAREGWDCVMRNMMDICNSMKKPVINDIIYHERHPTVWENPLTRYSIPSQIYNLTIAKQWFVMNNLNASQLGSRI